MAVELPPLEIPKLSWSLDLRFQHAFYLVMLVKVSRCAVRIEYYRLIR